MEKLNIAELLKNCPTGMELDCMMFEDVYFDHISDCGKFIYCYINYEDRKTSISFNKYGAYANLAKSKCVLFPKGKTTWEGFVPPCKFKDGDIIFAQYYDLKYVSIVKQIDKSSNIHVYCLYGFTDSVFAIDEILGSLTESFKIRFATDEEKQKLFQAIKDSGHKWNEETKKLEKLPKFKVGDKIRRKNNTTIIKTIGHIYSDGYALYDGYLLPFNEQDEWELVPNIKFDINTLKPFESKVLVRHSETSIWMPAIFGGYDIPNLAYYVVGGTWWKYCIPYKCNEHLRGTSADCSNYYKIWE